MIYRISDDGRWRELLTMLQTKYNPETEPWASCNEPGQFSFETGMADTLENMSVDSPGCVEIDYEQLRDKIGSLYCDAQELFAGAVEDHDEDMQAKIIDDFDSDVVKVCMEHVRPKYPVLVSIIDMEVGGGREGRTWKLMQMRMQSDESAGNAPSGYQKWLWHMDNHLTVDEFIARIRANGPWHVHRFIDNDHVLFYEVDQVLDMIDKARDCFADTSREDGVATRLDIDWNQFSQAHIGEACWKDKAGDVRCFMFVQERQ